MAENKAVYYGTGRRKTSVARVRLTPGTGSHHRQRARAADYFGREALVTFVEQPFKVTETLGRFDVIATFHGGGISGQAGALRHGIARALLEAGEEYRGELKRAGCCAATRVWSSARSTASRRPASARSSPSARRPRHHIGTRRGPPHRGGPRSCRREDDS